MKIPIVVITFLFMALIASTFGCQVEARAGPELISTSPPTSTVTATVNPSPFPTSIKTPTSISIPTPTPNGVEVTAMLTVKRCLQYNRIIIRWIEMEKAEKDDFHNLTLDNVPLVMAIMAAESSCVPHTKSSAGAIGLMQVLPRDWLPDVRSNGMNVYTGMYILDRSISNADGDVRLALAWYNCGEIGVAENKCGAKGGYVYAENVLNFWLPYFVKEN